MNSPVSFYNHISDNYNAVLEQEATNRDVRQKIIDKFKTFNSQYILDFGGGTGMDITWLSHKAKLLYFCEPAEKMRKKAMEASAHHIINQNILFLNTEEANFKNWLAGQHPFSHRIDTILANFAVINCIEDIEAVFEAFSLITCPGANVILNVIDTRFIKLLQHYPKNLIRFVLFGQKNITTTTHLHPYSHEVFLHTPAQIKRKSAGYFIYKSSEYIGGYGFLMIHLVRK